MIFFFFNNQKLENTLMKTLRIILMVEKTAYHLQQQLKQHPLNKT